MARILDFADGFESASEPNQGSISATTLRNYASDSDFVTDKGSAASRGDIYSRTTDNHIRYYNGSAWVDVIQEDASGNVTFDANVTVTGDLTIEGTQTVLNTQTLDVEDLNITINKGGNDASAEGAGITVDRTGTDGSLVYDSTKASKWKLGSAGTEAEILTVSDTQNISNKTFTDAPTFTQVSTPSTPASGYNKIYPKSDGNFYTLNSSGVEQQVGSGAGGGSKNYLGTVNNVNLNGNFELGATTGWSLSHTTLDSFSRPNQASGSWTSASGNLSISAVTSGKLAGSYSLSMVSSAASTAGDMLVSDAFTIDLEDQAKPLTFKAYYSPTVNPTNLNFSGTSSNTYHIYIYDVTNSAWIQPAGVYGMTQSSGVGYVTGTFQTTSNSTQYRLAVVNVNASAGAFTMLFDDFALGPQTAPIGAVVTDWQSYTPTINNIPGTASGKYRRVGDSAEIVVTVPVTGAATGSIAVSLPSGLTADSNKLADSTQLVGIGEMYDLSVDTGYIGWAYLVTSTTIGIYGPNNVRWAAAVPATWANGDEFTIKVEVPISGWSSNVQMSNDTDTRVVAWTGYTNSTQTMTSSFVQVTGFTSTNDTHGTFSSNSYTIPVSGFYRIVGSLYFAIQATSSQFIAAVYKNGAVIGYGPRTQSSSTQGVSAPFNDVFKFNAGDVITFYGYAATSTALNGGGVTGDQHWSITKESGPATVAASESVAAFATIGSTSSLSTTAAQVTGFSVADSSHGAFSSDTFTAPISGRYSVCADLMFNVSAFTSTAQIELFIYKNGANVKYARSGLITATQFINLSVTMLDLKLLAGDTVRVYARRTDTTITVGTHNDANASQLSIVRVGNY